VRNLWRVAVDPRTLEWTGGPDRLTTGVGADTGLALSADGTRLAFTARVESTRIWSLPFDTQRGKVTGDAQAVTPAGTNVFSVALSPDGTRVVYTARQPGTSKQEMRERWLADGREVVLAADESDRDPPLWSRDGTRLLYTRFVFMNAERTQANGEYCVMPADGGDEQTLSPMGGASGMGFPTDWLSGGDWFIGTWSETFLEPGTPTSLCLFRVDAARGAADRRIVASDPQYRLWQARFSPDERWVAFVAVPAGAPGNATVNVLPISGGEWRRVTDETYWADKPRWSPNGKALYFISNRGSAYFNVWGRRFDTVRGEPVGDAFPVTSIGSPGRMISPVMNNMEVSLGKDRLMLPITEATGNVWMLEGVDR
jgi:dipeptidyl aminopeptidase/acylaminoacyl peptidase